MALLKKFEHKVYSQNGEDGIISFLLDQVGRDKKYYVEFGASDGNECNTHYLRKHAGFQGLLMDGGYENHDIGLYQEMIFKDNINQLFHKYKVPNEFELLSIDVDGNDLWLWKTLDEKYQPKIVIMEYNGHLPPPLSATMPYSTEHSWDGTCYYGASLSALEILAKEKGYTLVGCDSKGINAFFIRNDYVSRLTKSFALPKQISEAFVPANCGCVYYITLDNPYGQTRYDLCGYTLYGHGRIDQSKVQFVEYPSGETLIIPEIDINFP
ncbi:hypothetical protein Lepto7376_1951 [[Leptolyngbya] sp. PCC 7376]|uniref:hypothetical protein n=1 Tax=[Leptolyngbya] sp. PCC 7376 TaxID=111781 RepID=UPI00029F33FC|nr:hypothetical protein [[Leptolyngbya] sp. PCC 7376]AFY38264.1 hypothetical protein Lepto7376_1951 [[Leptolyngbya] sp. PCC 7376]